MGSGALVVALLLTGPIVTYEWSEPEGPERPDLYEVEFTQEGSEPEILTTDVPSISLSPELGRAFEIRARACRSLTCGAWSELSQPVSLNRSADLTNDGAVGVADYLEFGRSFGTDFAPADLNGDTAVGIPDWVEFAKHYESCIGTVNVGGADVPAYVPCVATGP